MARMLQVRSLPDDVHAELVRRAKHKHVSLSDYVREILVREVAYDDPSEWFDRVRATRAGLRKGGPSGAELVREGREERDQYWDGFFHQRGEREQS